MIFACAVFKNNAPSSASAAEAATSWRITHRSWIGPFNLIGSFGWGTDPRKNLPDALLLARLSDKYDASECMFNIISEA
jgi:hypothetical protein